MTRVPDTEAQYLVASKPTPDLPSTTLKDPSAEIDAYSPSEHKTSIFYLEPLKIYDEEKPYFLNIPVTHIPGASQTNVSYTRRMVSITDIRGHESLFSLDKTGFEVGNLISKVPYEGFTSESEIIGTYYEETKELLKKHTGATHVMPFDYQVYPQCI